MRTLLLDRSGWNLLVDAGGNIAVASDPYSQAQDAASAIRLFVGEDYYDVTRGVPYFGQILGKAPPPEYMKLKFDAAALTVPGVTRAKSFLAAIKGRLVTGQVQITNVQGDTAATTF